MIKIRPETFETNSSTTHSCIIMTDDDNELWRHHNYYYYEGNWEFYGLDSHPKRGDLLRKNDAIKWVKKSKYYTDETEIDDQLLADMGFISADYYDDDEYSEFDTTTYTTPGGEKVVVYCKFGRD